MSEQEKPTPIGVIKEHLAVGTVVGRVEAIIDYINERKSGIVEKEGTMKGKEWSIQNILVVDRLNREEKIFLSLHGRPEVGLSEKDKPVELVAYRSPQHGLGGLYVDSYEKEGVVNKTLKMTKSGAFLIDGRELSEQPDETSQSTPLVTPQTPATTPPAQSTVQAPPDDSRPKPQKVFGATVGMAINNAVQLLIAEPDTGATRKQRSKFIYEHASDIIKISHMLESGKLAHVDGYEKPETPPETARPEPTEPLPEEPPQTQARSVDDAMGGTTERKAPPPGYEHDAGGNLVELDDVPF